MQEDATLKIPMPSHLKPRLSLDSITKLWTCIGGRVTGLGRTPEQAYNSYVWLKDNRGNSSTLGLLGMI